MMKDQDVKAAVSAKTGIPAHLVELRTQVGMMDEELQYIWVVPGVDAGMFFVEEDDLGGQTVVVLSGNE